jgi:hypothetical protein
VRFRLSKNWGRLETFGVVARGGAELSDVTLLTPDGNDVLVSGASQWASFNEDSGTPSRPLQRWHITRVAMPLK